MDQERIDRIIEGHQADPNALIQILLEIQRERHWLSKEALERISERLQVPMSRIRHITTFYKAFSLVPKGRHQIHLCMGTACHVRGAPRLLDTIQDLIGIKPGETDTDLRYSLETVNCLGCCAMGPVVEIDGRHHGNVTPSQIEGILKAYD